MKEVAFTCFVAILSKFFFFFVKINDLLFSFCLCSCLFRL